MSGLPQASEEKGINGVDVREHGNALRVATNTPHLVSLGTGRLSTAVTLHPIRQGRITIGTDLNSDIRLQGTGVNPEHCRVENSHGVVTLYPVNGITLIDGTIVDRPTRLSQGCMLTIGRSNYLRFNHPEEAKLMKSVLPNPHISMSPIQFHPDEDVATFEENHHYQPHRRADTLSELDRELDKTLKEMNRRKPPVAPRKTYKELDQMSNSSSSDQDSGSYISTQRSKTNSIMAKVSKFEYYAKSQQKNGRISNDNGVFSPKVFSANSMTVNTPAKDVLGGKTTPSHVPQNNSRIFINENNAVDARSCSYANVTVRSQANMIDRMAKNFENAANATNQRPFEARPTAKIQQPSPSFDRNPNFNGMDRGPTEKPSQRAQQARLHEEQEKDTENERLEEILHMCAEYEKQISSGIPITPTEKKPHNKIITNGSLPRSIQNSPNIVQTSEGYFIFDTGSPARLACSPFHSTPNPKPPSSYENVGFPIDTRQRTATGYENVIIENAPQRHFPITELSSPVMIRKISRNAQNSSTYTPVSPIGSPYDNLRLLSGKTESNSPRTRIKTTFAHKTPSSPQYFIFPSPPPIEELYEESDTVQKRDLSKCTGIEKQLSITEEIPMIDDSELTNDVEQRSNEQRSSDQRSILRTSPDLIPNGRTNKFEEIRQYLMADIPELEEIGKNIEKNLKPNNVEIVQAEINLTAPTFTEKEEDSLERERRARFEDLKERRKKVLSEIYELKSALSEIRTQEDDILRELEMEKALLKGEYDSEIAILNIEQQKKSELIEKARKFESKMRESKQKQDRQQGEMRDRVDLASLKYDRVEKDFGENRATSDELRNAQEVLENERKLFEDTEFQHLEEEAEWLAYREDLQNDIIALTQKIESQKSRILTLKSEATSNLKLALEESKGLQGESVKILNKIEELTNRLRTTDDLIRETGLAWMMERPLSPEYGKIVSSNLTYRNSKPLIGSVVLDSPPSSDDGEDLFASLDSSEGTRRKNFKEKFLSIDQMSRSMIVDLGEKRNIDDLIDPETSSPESIEKPSSPETKEKKPGFWERNFDSLSRLKKDKKNKPKPDVMSQSLNENLFFNNDNIESEIGCFEKTKHKTTHSKIPTLTALGKMIRKDSITKKGKDGSVEPAIANKENIDSNSSIEVSPNPESKTRYIKNQKATHSENRYLNRSGKSPEKSHQNSSSEENRLSLTDSLEGDCDPLRKSDAFNRVMSESQRVPSQEDIDRMSKVTLDSPLVSKDGDMDSLGRKTLDSLMEIEKRRMELLELKGCQVIENEREKISELKKRVQNEAKLLWESRLSQPKEVEELEISEEQVTGTTDTSADNETRKEGQEISNADSSSVKEVGLENESCSVFDDSTIGDSASIEKHRHSQTDSYNSSALIDDDPRSSSRNRLTTGNGSLGRPLSEVSDMSDNSTVPNFPIIQGSRDIPMRQRKNLNSSAYCPRTDLQRPLTRYLPIDNDQLNLRSHIETAGHQVEMCPHVSIDMTSCRGYLHKLGAKFHTWSKRWFVFDRTTKTLIYYSDKSEKKPRGGAYFQVIEEVYLDHLNMSKSPNPRTTFVLKTKQRKYYLMAPSGEAARIWIDVIFTGAQGYTEYQ